MTTTFRNWISAAFNLSILGRDRHIWIDYLRGLVIILVVYHHAFLGMVRSGIAIPQSILDANMAAYSFRMPLFFIFSGIFTGLSLNCKPAKAIIWNKFSFLFYPYVIWAIIQISLQIIFPNYSNSNVSYKDYLDILYQPKRIAHFWYLPALFNSTVIFVLIKNKWKIKSLPHLLLGLLFFLLAPFVNSISMMSNWMRFYIFLTIGDALSRFILEKQLRERLQRPLYFLALVPIFIVAQLYYFKVIGVRPLENESASMQVNFIYYTFEQLSFLLISLVGCTTFILLSFLIEKWNQLKWLRIVGFHSLYIYIMHVIVIAFFRTIFIRLFGTDNYLLFLAAAIILGVIIPIIFYNLIGKKYLWFLFYLKRPEPSKQREPGIRTAELRIPPLHPTVNNI
ncbi:MAG: acyltransferase family protein [Flavisolibacter sp.]